MAVYYDDYAPEGTPAGERDRKRVALHGPSLRRALKAGVKIAFGTDVGGFSWNDPIAQEFPRMVEFGMTPMAAIQSATSRAAEMLGMSGRPRRHRARAPTRTSSPCPATRSPT